MRQAFARSINDQAERALTIRGLMELKPAEQPLDISEVEPAAEIVKKFATGAELSEAEKMQRERLRIGDLKGIVSYEWAADSQAILVPLDGDLYLARLDGTVQRLSDTPEDELNPALSPKGGLVSFVRGRRLCC